MNQSSATQHHPSSTDHNKTQRSSTLNRKYVKRPNSKVIQSVAKRRAEDLKRRQAIAAQINRERLAAAQKNKKVTSTVSKTIKKDSDSIAPAKVHPYQKAVKARTAQRTVSKEQISAKKLKDEAIKKALRSVATAEQKEAKNKAADLSVKNKFGAKNIIFALSATAVIIFAIGYFIKVNMPNISVQVAAMKAGIEAKYPTFIPKEFSLKKTSSETNQVTLTFESNGGTFDLVEEKTSWDSTALLSNYVKKTWQDYSIIREQGLTIYVSSSNAAWINSGILYKINAPDNLLAKQQIRSIATSL